MPNQADWGVSAQSLTIPFSAGPFDPHTVIGPDVPAELAAYYAAKVPSITLTGGTFEYFGGNPNPYRYHAVAANATPGQIQIAEGYVVWNAGVATIVPSAHLSRPTDNLSSTHQVWYDPDDFGSSHIWSPNSTRGFDIQTMAGATQDYPFVKWNGDPLDVMQVDYLGQSVADLTLSSADQFLAGSLSFTVHGGNNLGSIYILGVFDFDVTVAAAGQRVIGVLYRDGAAVVVPLATLTQVAVGRATVAQIWQYVPSDHNTHTFDLYARKTGAGGTAICRQNGTRMFGLCKDVIIPA